MDFADIAFTISEANIFSGIEPCLAVVLASAPMMHPLLGRSTATPYGSDQRPANRYSKSVGAKVVSDDSFERLDDDTSNLWLTPMGLQYRADASALAETVVKHAGEGDEESLDGQKMGGRFNGRGL
jgi:hypothetical protein